MFLGFTQEKYCNLIPDKHEVQSFLWHKANYDSEGSKTRYALEQEFKGGDKLLHLISILLNKEGDQIGYWFVEVVSKNTFFKTWEQVEEAINNGKLKLV